MKLITGCAPLDSPCIGSSTISRTELMTVITPTYKSPKLPPQICRVLLQTICTKLLVAPMTNPEIPRDVICRTSFPCNFMDFHSRGIITLPLRRNRSTQIAETA